MLVEIRNKIRSMVFNFENKTNNKVRVLGPVSCRAREVSFGRNVTLCPGVEMFGGGRLVIGDNVAIGKDTIIYCHESIVIGANTLISAQAYIIDCDHGIRRDEAIINQGLVSTPVIIGEDVWLGAGAKVLKGSTIAKGSVIGAQGLVNGETKSYSINVGIPTRHIGYRV